LSGRGARELAKEDEDMPPMRSIPLQVAPSQRAKLCKQEMDVMINGPKEEKLI
jgi:hypothetical protein